MKQKLKVEVTSEHIAKGDAFNPCGCPIALAILQAVRHPFVVVAVSTGIVIRQNTYPMPAEVIAFIDAFDAGQPVQPFTFEIEVYECDLNLIP